MNNEFIIELSSDLNFEGMVIEITFRNRMTARLNYDKGINNVEMEIICSSKEIVLPMQDFLNALEKAKKLVHKCFHEDQIQLINQLLLQEWDPMDANRTPGTEEEYLEYAPEIYQIIQNSSSHADLFNHLSKLIIEHPGWKQDRGKIEELSQMLFNRIKAAFS